MNPRYASVYPLVTARAVARPFTYEVPEDVERGAVVQIPFGRSHPRGVVIEVDAERPDGVQTAPIERIVGGVPGTSWSCKLKLWR